MQTNASKIAVIPAYNPDSKLLEVIDSLKLHGFTVIVINDGSDPGFSKVFESASEADMILTHKRNLGKGSALKTGFDYVRRNFTPPYVVATVDADGQHETGNILTVARAAKSNPGTLIIGSRRLGSDAPIRSRSGNFITRKVLHALTPVKVYDTQSGLRAFDSSLIDLMCEIPGERYEYETRVMIELTRRGVPIKEVRIMAVYIGDNSSSHFRTWYDAQRIYRVIFRSAGKRVNK